MGVRHKSCSDNICDVILMFCSLPWLFWVQFLQGVSPLENDIEAGDDDAEDQPLEGEDEGGQNNDFTSEDQVNIHQTIVHMQLNVQGKHLWSCKRPFRYLWSKL